MSDSVSISNLLRGIIAFFVVVATGAAFAEGHYGLAIAGLVFVGLAVVLGLWSWRRRDRS